MRVVPSSSPSSGSQPSSSTSPVATSAGYSSQSGQYMTSITLSSPIKLSSFHFSTSLSSSLTSRKCYDNTYIVVLTLVSKVLDQPNRYTFAKGVLNFSIFAQW